MTSITVERRRLRVRIALLSLSTILCSGLAAPAFAQAAAPAPVRNNIDANGVDLFLGTMNVDGPALSVGNGKQGIKWQRQLRGNLGWSDTLIGSLSTSGSNVYISFGGTTDQFTKSGTTFTSTEGNGATLVQSGTNYTYTASDGTVAVFSSVYANQPYYGLGSATITSVTKPSGLTFTYHYESFEYCLSYSESNEFCETQNDVYRISTITTNAQYSLTLHYDTWDPSTIDPNVPYTGLSLLLPFYKETGVSVTNTAISGASSRSQTFADDSIVDAMSRTTGYRFSTAGTAWGSRLLGITHAGRSSEDVTLTYDGSNRVYTLAGPVGTMTYAYSDASGVRTTTVTDPGGHVTVYTFDIASQRMLSATNPLSKTISEQYDTSGRLTRVTAPEGNYAQYNYDGRGNVTETRLAAKSGSGLADIVTTADYDATCSNTVTCNKPNWTKDAKGNETDYTYDSSTGNLLTVTSPAPTTGAVQPKTTYSYTTTSGMQLLTGISTCQTTASCVGAADEVKTTIGYNSNLLPTTVAKGAGNGSLTATTTIGYDDVGNRTSVDGPLSGTDDTTTYRYDADREMVGVISPDPDGAGPLKRRAARTTYSVRGVVTEVEAGTVTGTDDTSWAAFNSLQQAITTLDSADRRAQVAISAGGITYALKQYSYDVDGRPECTALRMNSATWSSLPSSACTPATTGSYGPDRIVKTTYDAAGQPSLVVGAYGTADQASEAASTFNDNGTTATFLDANGNLTSYLYDGFDRLSKVFYPVTTAGAGLSSTTDYIQLTYDAASQVVARRLRDGNSIAYTYDADGRITFKDLPSGEADVTYTYDLLGRTTSAATSGQTLTIGYDALGRVTSQGGPLGTMATEYNLAGQRTKLTWPDGFYVNYDRLLTGEVAAIRENGATSGIGILVSFAYDDLGRRTGISRGNGSTTAYGYDTGSRLTSQALDLAGTSGDLALGFSYNPANQITATTRSNDSYAWTASADRNDASSVNGLNQITSVGSGSVGYDSKGNLSSTGSNTYTYSSENLLLTGPSSAALSYDPVLRLYQETGTSTSRFLYDGRTMVGEYNTSGALQKRYVFDIGSNTPFLEYDVSGSSVTRVWLHADERGSIIAQSDDTGTLTSINGYDEFGVPAAGNVGRFQYTGQAYLPSIGAYYYASRIYAARLGRFMQTDTIGYQDGANWYTYVGADPINKVDPLGTTRVCADEEAQTGCYDSNDEVVVNGRRPAPPPYDPPPVFDNPSPDFGNPGLTGGNAPGADPSPIEAAAKKDCEASEHAEAITTGLKNATDFFVNTGKATLALAVIATFTQPEAAPELYAASRGAYLIAGFLGSAATISEFQNATPEMMHEAIDKHLEQVIPGDNAFSMAARQWLGDKLEDYLDKGLAKAGCKK